MSADTLWTIIFSLLFTIIGAAVDSFITLRFTNLKEHKQAKTRFNNRLRCVAKELQSNINNEDAGTHNNPFHTPALEQLVNDELIHTDKELFNKAFDCLYDAQIVSTSFSRKATDKTKEKVLIKDLSDFISNKYGHSTEV